MVIDKQRQSSAHIEVATKRLLCLAAIFMAANIILGTLSAHLWHDLLLQNNAVANFSTARDYLFVHGLSVMIIAVCAHLFPKNYFVAIGSLQLIAVTIFSGSLMIAGLTGVEWIKNITPTGGSTLILSWLLLAWRAIAMK